MQTQLLDITKIYFALFGFLFFFCQWKRVRLLSIPLFTLSLVGLLILPFTFFGTAASGVTLVFILNGMCAIGGIWLIITRIRNGRYHNDLRPLKECLGFAAFYTLLFYICGIIARYNYLSIWDEFDNYTEAVKSLLLYGRRMRDCIHADYPYGMSLLHFFFVSCSDYNEHILIFASVLTFVYAAVFTASYSSKPYRSAVLLCILADVLVFFFDYEFHFPGLLLDCLIAVCFAAVIVSATHLPQKPNWIDSLERIVIFGFFIFIKDACAALLLVCLILMFHRLLHENKIRGGIKTWIIICAGSVLPYLAWTITKAVLHYPHTQALDKINLPNIRLMLAGGNDYATALQLFFQKTFGEIYGNTGMSLFVLYLVLFLTLYVSVQFNSESHTMVMNRILLLGALAYTFYVGLAYIFVIGRYYRETFSQYNRFILSYVMGWTLALLSYLNEGFREYRSKRVIFIIISCFILARTPLLELVHRQEPEREWVQAKRFYQDFHDSLNNEDRIFTLSESEANMPMFQALFYGETRVVTRRGVDPENLYLTKERLAEVFNETDADYVYVYRPDNFFWIKFGSIFDRVPENIQTYHLFKRGENGFELIR